MFGLHEYLAEGCGHTLQPLTNGLSVSELWETDALLTLQPDRHLTQLTDGAHLESVLVGELLRVVVNATSNLPHRSRREQLDEGRWEGT